MICAFDATVWQHTNEYYIERMQFLNNVCSMGPNNVGHIQFPVVQAQTTLNAATNHKRKLEDVLLNADMDFSQNLTLIFSKETARSRCTSQSCVLAFAGKGNKWQESEITANAVLGPLDLLPVSSMQGYDADNRPSAGARAEQILER